MMKASELRIGNYYNHNGDYKKVNVNVIEELEISDRIWIEPIELTEEILLKCGFEKDIDDLYLDINIMLFVSYNDDEFVHLKSNNLETIISIKHLHELQNLYFALTNQELEIQL